MTPRWITTSKSIAHQLTVLGNTSCVSRTWRRIVFAINGGKGGADVDLWREHNPPSPIIPIRCRAVTP